MSVIKEIRVEITPILFHLFNRSLKKAKFITLFKYGDGSKNQRIIDPFYYYLIIILKIIVKINKS